MPTGRDEGPTVPENKGLALSDPRRFIDLHTHSTASDGSLAPAEVVRLADREHLAAVALTDHDTTDGLDEARAAAQGCPQLRWVPGVEVSAVFSPGTLHLLGLGIDQTAPALRELTARFRAAREERNPRIISKLQALGLPIDMDDVRAAAPPPLTEGKRVLSRLHIARALQEKRLVRSIAEAFDRYLGDGAAAYVPKDRMAPAEVIAAIHASGGAAVAAHPVQMRCRDEEHLERAIRSLVDAGLDGIEVYHSDHSDRQTRCYLDLARWLGLLVTGGSDFHGSGKPHVTVGRPRTTITVVDEPWASRWFSDDRATGQG